MSHVTLLTGPERRRRWSEEDQCRILAAAFAPGAKVAAVARQYDVATSLIYKWRSTMRARETGFTEVKPSRQNWLRFAGETPKRQGLQ